MDTVYDLNDSKKDENFTVCV